MLHFVDIKISKKYNNTDMKNLNLLSYRQTDRQTDRYSCTRGSFSFYKFNKQADKLLI